MTVNWLLLALYLITIVVEIGLPVALAVWLLRKYSSSWMLIVTGMITYAISELIHIPALNGLKLLFSNGTLPTPAAQWVPLLNGLVIGLLAGLVENILRWVGFKVNGKNSKPFRSGVALAIGHGGVELALVGILIAVNLGSVLFYNAGAQIAKGVATSTVQATLQQIASYWASPWYYSPISLFEHLVTFTLQFVASFMVWRAVAQRRPLWLLLAVLYQTVNEGIVTFLSGQGWGLWEIEGILALFLLLNVLMIYFFWTNEGGLESEPEEDEDEEGEDSDDDSDEDEDDENEDKDETEKSESDSPESEPAA
jgi:uncharacterized membrane protein YhfC